MASDTRNPVDASNANKVLYVSRRNVRYPERETADTSCRI
jgi:hypothetical protein